MTPFPRVLPIVKVKGGVACGRVDLVIVGEFSKHQPLGPVRLMVIGENPEVVFDFLIELFCLTIRLWVVYSAGVTGDAKLQV